tara:strand:+ start:137 stop:985 length:849 start_codon:yes stop_codon:yes gene_type:complete
MKTSLREAAIRMFNDRAWLCIPLRKDTNGLAKVPMTQGWPNLEPSLSIVESLPWERADGLGIVLGEKSNNLAVLDVDDEELAQVIMLHCWNSLSTSPRLVRTARNRLHIYFEEMDGPSLSSKQVVKFDGRDVVVELKANGTQVAAPPTPRYKLLNHPEPPLPFFSIAMAWEFITDCLTASSDRLQLPTGLTPTRRYPEPWQDVVPAGQRDDSAYIEAQQLREAKMSEEKALRVMHARWTESYEQQGFSWYEVQKTVRSAYKKGTVVDPYDRKRSELELFNHE